MSETSVLDLSEPVSLTETLVDIPSPSHQETAIADAVEAALRTVSDIEVIRHQNNVLARTRRGLDSRVILAGHLDTVPAADNLPSTRGDDEQGRDTIFGCGAVDMKSGLAVYLHTFATLAADPGLQQDLTLIAYECEEVTSEFNGLGHIQRDLPEWLQADLALLGEPSGAIIEAGCQGSIQLGISAAGKRAHSARPWLGDNASHKLSPVISRIADYQPRRVEIDGCEYREGLSIVRLESGSVANVIPDLAELQVNFRFAPDRSTDQALAHLYQFLQLDEFEGITPTLIDALPAAPPGLQSPAAAQLLEAVGGRFRAKYGWTDVSRFAALGIPALNFGPGDPSFAHTREEQCPVVMITEVAQTLKTWLGSNPEAVTGADDTAK